MGNDIGRLVARLTLGVLLLFHGVHTLLTGLAPVQHLLADHHWPQFLAYGVYAGEIAAPLLVILGLFSRLGAALIVVDLAVAIYLAQLHSLFAIGSDGGYALELAAFYLLGGIGVMLTGAGPLSLGGEDGPLN